MKSIGKARKSGIRYQQIQKCATDYLCDPNMSRFGNLEFTNDSGGELQPEGEVLSGDEARYLAEAQTAFEAGRFEPGLRLYSKVLEYNPRNTRAWAGQVRMLIELGEHREAKVWADKALERFPNDPELLAAKAVALGRSGDLDGALAFSDAAMGEQGDSPYVWLARGDVLLARSEPLADYCFEKAFFLAPGDWFTLWLAARIRFYYRQFVVALKVVQQAMELNAGQLALWLEQGYCQQALGMVGAAKKSFNQARQLDPNCREARDALHGMVRTGMFARVRGIYRRLFHR